MQSWLVFIVQRRQPLFAFHDIAVGAGEAVACCGSQMIPGCLARCWRRCPAHLQRAVAIIFTGVAKGTARGLSAPCRRQRYPLRTKDSRYVPACPIQIICLTPAAARKKGCAIAAYTISAVMPCSR